MIAILQRVQNAHVKSFVGGELTKDEGFKGWGLMVLLGVEVEDTEEDLKWLARKTTTLKLFPDNIDDKEDYLEKSIVDAGASLMVVSQFTLHARTKKGTKPSFDRAAPPIIAKPLYNQFVETCQELINKPVFTGSFGAHMEIEMSACGPVTILLDSKDKK